MTSNLTLTEIITIYFAGGLTWYVYDAAQVIATKIARNFLMELIELNPCATMSLKPGGHDVQNIDLRWILATIVESGNH